MFQNSLFWRYANFSKLIPTIHTSMASTFQCEYWHCFIFKRCNKLHNVQQRALFAWPYKHIQYQSWRYAWWALIWKKLARRQNSGCCKAGIQPKRLFFVVVVVVVFHLKLFDIYIYIYIFFFFFFFIEYHLISYLCLPLSLFACACFFFLMGESFLKSLFTFFLLTKRVNP